MSDTTNISSDKINLYLWYIEYYVFAALRGGK